MGYCTGCYACQKTGRCVIKDDAAAILKKMLATDVIVFASPVYFYSICAQLKTLIDRTVAVYPNITNKQYYFLATLADEAKTAAGALQVVNGFLDCYEGSELKGTLVVGGVYEQGRIKGTKFLEKAYKMGLKVK